MTEHTYTEEPLLQAQSTESAIYMTHSTKEWHNPYPRHRDAAWQQRKRTTQIQDSPQGRSEQ